jgi:hypothetical protein
MNQDDRRKPEAIPLWLLPGFLSEDRRTEGAGPSVTTSLESSGSAGDAVVQPTPVEATERALEPACQWEPAEGGMERIKVGRGWIYHELSRGALCWVPEI